MDSDKKLELKRKILDKKVIKLIIMEDSEELKKANRLVNEYRKIQDDIKKLYQEFNILKHEVKIDDKIKVLEFELKYRKILDKELIPDEIIEEYSIETYSWYKKIYET